jgi:peptide/nickel transport system ATP-binding protein
VTHPPGQPLLTVTGLSLAVGAVGILSDIALTIDRGEAVGIIGESGSGKSMFARTLLGLLPRHSSVQGSAWFDDRDLLRLSRKEYRGVRGRRIAFIPQDPAAAYNPTLSVGRQIDEPNEFHPRARGEARQTPAEMLASVAINEPGKRARQYPHELSGGMLQRGLIASAMTLKPSLLIADEPTTALDVTTQAGIVELLIEMQSRHGMALLLISHDLALVSNICSRIVVLFRGAIVEAGPTESIIRAPAHDYTRALVEATPILEHAP